MLCLANCLASGGPLLAAQQQQRQRHQALVAGSS
jgi:hypothetical protein